MRVHSAASTETSVSCCGNILWFEKCNTSEYAAGGHRPTRSDAAKPNGASTDFPFFCYRYLCPNLSAFGPKAKLTDT
ncbi:unnamed protein product [Nesidiocoris tenuis]|uniref:Uncharacterized protein n=1 Tax=Nesidiocoris tenuis TaxID=355587 RepID=A0A6H5GIH1_9HEMI|nr:unnamed protein product [Nesidiocoris tenuis]